MLRSLGQVQSHGCSARELDRIAREEPAELRRSLPRVACSGPGVGLELLTGDALFPPVATREGAIAGLLFSVPPPAPSEAERVFVLSIAGARRSLYIANAYFVPNRAGRRLLSDAARGG